MAEIDLGFLQPPDIWERVEVLLICSTQLGGKGPVSGEESKEKEKKKAWGIPWTEEPDGPQSMGSQKVGHD